MISVVTDEFIEERFHLLFHWYQQGQEKLMRGRKFVHNNADGLLYKYRQINFSRSGSYIGRFSTMVKKQKSPKKLLKKDDICLSI